MVNGDSRRRFCCQHENPASDAARCTTGRYVQSMYFMYIWHILNIFELLHSVLYITIKLHTHTITTTTNTTLLLSLLLLLPLVVQLPLLLHQQQLLLLLLPPLLDTHTTIHLHFYTLHYCRTIRIPDPLQ